MPLTAADVDRFLREGQPAQIKDGRSLFLIVKSPGVGGWKGRARHGGKVRNHWIGPAPAVKLKDARAEWERMRSEIRESIRNGAAADVRSRFARAARPIARPTAARPLAPPGVTPLGMTFDQGLHLHIEAKAAEWANGATGKTAHLYLKLADVKWPDGRRLGELTEPELSDDAIAFFVREMKIRDQKETSERINAVRARMTGHYKDKKPEAKHHDAYPWRDLPAFYAALDMTDPCARALAFVILTAVRVGDLSGNKFKKPATWAEIESDVWHVPKTRTKNKVDFDVPLTPTALSLIGKRGDAKAPLFAIDGSAYDKVDRLVRGLRKTSEVPFKIHGFRSTFSDWCGAKGIDLEISELCLQHKYGNAVMQAYRRDLFIDRRRKEAMEPWAGYCTSARTMRHSRF
jgi:integrase